jgi:hypothetical protein
MGCQPKSFTFAPLRIFKKLKKIMEKITSWIKNLKWNDPEAAIAISMIACCAIYYFTQGYEFGGWLKGLSH